MNRSQRWLTQSTAGLALVVLGAQTGAQGFAAAHRADLTKAERIRQGLERGYVPGSILVKFRHDTPAALRANARALVRGQLRRSYGIVPGLEHIRTDEDAEGAVAFLKTLPFVEYAEPDYIVHPTGVANDEFFGLEWGLHNTGQDIQGVTGVADADIDVPEAWDITTGDGNLVIAVIDTGTQWSHPDLDDNIWINAAEANGVAGVDDDGNGFVDDVRGWDFFSDDNNPDDEDGHGTHTAGTVGAEGNNLSGISGVVWQSRIMPLRFLGPFGGSTSDAIAALNYAVANGARVSNNSWGGGGASNSLFEAISNAGAAGHIFVAAAGNSGVNTDSSPHYPSSYNLDNILSVAATDNRDRLASFSNYGPTSVDIGAPGVDIASTFTGSGFAWLSGTSMAAPHVTGVVALVWSANPTWTSTQVVDRILATGRPVSSLAGLTVTGSVVNAHAALTGSTPPPPPGPPATPGNVNATNNGDGSATITWTDVEDESNYEVQREELKRNGRWRGTTTVAVLGADVTSHVDAAGGGTYRYRVRATSSAGASDWSAWSQVDITGGGGGGKGGGGGGGGGNGNGNGNGPPR